MTMTTLFSVLMLAVPHALPQPPVAPGAMVPPGLQSVQRLAQLSAAEAQVRQQVDTTFAVQRGGRLDLEMFAGSAVIRTWDRDAMRVVANYSRTAQLVVRQRNGGVSVTSERPGSFMGPVGLSVRYEITVPRSYSVSVDGMTTDVTVDGVQGTVAVENVEGAIRVTGVTGNVDVTSVSGTIAVENVRGNVRVEAINQTLTLSGIRGDVSVETINGGIRMQRMESRSVQASTVSGAVEYSGTIADGGRYYLGTHNGRITMAVPEQANATMAISTRNGQVDSAFPVRVGSTRNGRVTLTLGSGSANVELESFNGTVRLVRP
ncbi:MAG TPA: DUF4097 family beta strand repeat-containing protein [Longimicrobiales bacterium]|nr:DUF4097 family beta strand repeat-containing protein [Longimicrobiales bacterium]